MSSCSREEARPILFSEKLVLGVAGIDFPCPCRFPDNVRFISGHAFSSVRDNGVYRVSMFIELGNEDDIDQWIDKWPVSCHVDLDQRAATEWTWLQRCRYGNRTPEAVDVMSGSLIDSKRLGLSALRYKRHPLVRFYPGLPTSKHDSAESVGFARIDVSCGSGRRPVTSIARFSRLSAAIANLRLLITNQARYVGLEILFPFSFAFPRDVSLLCDQSPYVYEAINERVGRHVFVFLIPAAHIDTI